MLFSNNKKQNTDTHWAWINLKKNYPSKSSRSQKTTYYIHIKRPEWQIYRGRKYTCYRWELLVGVGESGNDCKWVLRFFGGFFLLSEFLFGSSFLFFLLVWKYSEIVLIVQICKHFKTIESYNLNGWLIWSDMLICCYFNKAV